jgi:hypothetical protein
MPQWEYAFLTNDHLGKYVYYFNGETFTGWQLEQDKSKGDKNANDAYHREIAELGGAGWELVSAAIALEGNYH